VTQTGFLFFWLNSSGLQRGKWGTYSDVCRKAHLEALDAAPRERTAIPVTSNDRMPQPARSYQKSDLGSDCSPPRLFERSLPPLPPLG